MHTLYATCDVSNMLRSTIALTLLVFLPTLCCAEIVSKKSDRSSPHNYEYYHDDAESSTCDSVIMINVGTFMSPGAYSKLAHAIVVAGSHQNKSSSGTIAIIVDSNPYRIMKDDGKKYADVVNAIADSISNILAKCVAPPLYFIGGHSGGGKGAMNALDMKLLKFPVAGFVGLDPYEVSEQDRINLRIDVPSLQWGFSETSCLVVKEKAAEAAYNISNTTQRVFYRVDTMKPKTIVTGPHCSFANHGCFGACQSAKGLPWIRTQVGISLNHFVTAIKSNNFDRNQFIINEADAVLFVNDDMVPQ